VVVNRIGGGEFPRQVVVDYVDADLFRTVLGVAEFAAEIVDEESDVAPDQFVVCLEYFPVEVLDGAK
jgi:hypothetical protein